MHKTKIVMPDDWENFFTSNIDCSTFGDTIDFKVYQQTLMDDKLYAAIAEAEVIILLRERTAVNQHFIDHAPHLKHIICTGNQVRNLDSEAVEKAGISISFAKGGDSKSSTCELAWTLILASFKQLDKLRIGQAQPLWRQYADKQPAFIPPTLRGKQLGIIGLGSIGQKVASVAKAFGMNVVCWSPNMTPERAAEHGVEAVSLESLLSNSDVISIHLVLSETTRHILNAQHLSLLKRNAILVNTSRAELINTEALLTTLKENMIFYATDVFEIEPLPSDHPFYSLDNVLMSAHFGFVAQEVYQLFAENTTKELKAYLS
ncbi:NAD(P)-dependent oxidoreductase [Oligella sp. HMSC09E12]|uniref:NAD(P)-dependent oxidoreductase n=1 Tax=Oligella sp. HMSC09E12 TaxID=1581147 RepID=UPI0008A6180A|nr:NAD(P)-dependent oxidoreductase [Oligella sp. HMSC09E12]OFV46197.1 hypothetical protein HMPREF3179_10855 [Oligella sp. HMSC09E12]